MYKKDCVWSPQQLWKKRVIIMFNVYIVIISDEGLETKTGLETNFQGLGLGLGLLLAVSHLVS